MATLKSSVRRRRPEAPRKGDLREEAILDTAEALLEKEGLDPVTVAQIAEGAGISRAALYFYFGSKQEVLTALVARTMALIREDADVLAGEVDDVHPKATVERMTRRIEKNWIEHGVVMRAAVESSPLIPEVRELWNSTVNIHIAPLTRVLVRAGFPDRKGPDGARAMAQGLTWMSERNFYIAATNARPNAEIRRASQTVIAIWWRAMGIEAGP
jgi:AcrR family transcriptional regulator